MTLPPRPALAAPAWTLCAAVLCTCLGAGAAMAQPQGMPAPALAPAAVPALAPAVTPASAPVAAAPPPTVVAPSMMVTNLFDKDRKVWPDRVPPPPPPAPPPAPPQVTDEDMQVYGVVITGQTRQATVRVGKRFAHLAPVGRSFANLAEGQSLGEFTLAAVRPDHVVLHAPGGEQRLYFTRKTDRAAGQAGAVAAAPAPVQGATSPVAEAPAAGAGMPAPMAGAAAPAMGTAPVANGVVQQAGQGDAGAAAPVASPFNLRNSLAAAIEAARSNNANNNPRQGGAPAGAEANPFQK